MRVALVGACQEENLALGYLAASLRAAGHRADIVAFDGPDDVARVVRAVLADPPDLVGMSVAFQHRVTEFRDLAKALRGAGVTAPIVWGGHVPTARPGAVLQAYPWVDIAARHDGEETIVDLAAVLGDRPWPAPADPEEPREAPPDLAARLAAVPGIAFRLPGGRPGATPPRPAVRDLDTLAPPARDAFPARHAGLPFAPLVGSRGCWQRCAYCSIQTFHRGRGGPRVRFRDPEAVADEMADLYHRLRVRLFCFHDENFFLKRPARTIERLRALRLSLERRGVGRIGVVAKCRPDEVTPEVLDEACRLGLVRVYVGIENGSQAGLDHLGRDTDVATCRRALTLLREAGVYACFNILLFEPDTRVEDVGENLAFLKDFCDFPWNFCRTEVYPGSFLERSLKGRGRLRGGLEGYSYAIEDPRAELCFRVSAVAFGGRNFGPQSTANEASSLGYLAALVRHFHPGSESRDLGLRVEALIRRFGEDTLAHLEEAYGFARTAPHSPAEVTRFARDLALRVAFRDTAFWSEMAGLRRAIERHGTTHAREVLEPETLQRTGARAAAVLAAAALVVPGCERAGGNHVVDPLPSDVPDVRGAEDVASDEPWVVDPVPWDARPDELMVVDPPPPDARDAADGEDPSPDEVLVVDPPPPDAKEAGPDDVLVVDPPPPDAVDAGSDGEDRSSDEVLVVDPLPPDVVEDAGQSDDAGGVTPELPPVDPPPPDFGAAPQAARDLPLDRSFRVRLRASSEPGVTRLTAMASGAPDARFEWWALGGRVEAEGPEARFFPDPDGPGAVVVVAWSGEGDLDAARWLTGEA